MRVNFVVKSGEALFLTDSAAVAYASGFNSSLAVFVKTNGEEYFFTDKRYLLAANEFFSKSNVKCMLFEGYQSIYKMLKNNGVTKILADFSTLPLEIYLELKKEKFKIKNAEDSIKAIFSVKSKEDLENCKKASEITEKAFSRLLPFIKEGVTEKYLADKLEGEMRSLGAIKQSFDIVVAFGENSAVPHHETSLKTLEKNVPVLIDFGCVVGGICSDCTRTLFFGEPSEKFVKTYETVKKAKELAEENIKSNMLAKDADKIARDYLKSLSLGRYFTHSLGHGVGREIHENPYLSPKNEREKLKNGQIFTIEPGVYFDGEFGIRIEDTVVLKNGRVKNLFKSSKELIILR